MRIILGSQSPRRAEILRAVLPPEHSVEVLPADIDEKAIRHPHPSELTMAIARAKNWAVCERIEGDAIVVTADTVAVCAGVIREKPQDAAELRKFVETYRWFPVIAVTSVYVHRTGTDWSGSGTDAATTTFRPFTDGQIDAIAAERAFYGSAGGFLIEHALMRGNLIAVEGDPETVQGLPGRLTRRLVQDALASS